MKTIDVDIIHESLFDNNKPLLAFDKNADYPSWKEEIRKKYIELLGLDVIAKNACDLHPEIEEVYETGEYTRYRYVFESEKNSLVPCYLLIPKDGLKKHPVCICLQGHTSGFHISIGIKKFEQDDMWLESSAYGLEAVKRGYATLCVEQRGFGERMTPRQDRGHMYPTACYHTAMVALLLGRTMIGERVWDVSKAIDTLEMFSDKLDLNDISLIGNSGGGTATYYAACFDPRIKVALSSCAVCTYRDSIVEVLHCTCNYIPRIAEYMDMGELACLISPRKLIICNGELDDIFLLKGTKKVYKVIEQIYEIEHAKDNCKMVVYEGKPHYFDSQIAFDELEKMRKKP